MHYELDRLGWHNFEWLCQTWLKAEFGFSVETWGGYKDQGRDAYSSNDIKNVSGQLTYAGPVIFQIKFVAQANATSSNYKNSLLGACKAEGETIKKRIRQKLWEDPKTYVLLTNAPVSAAVKKEIADIFSSITNAKVVVLSGVDISQGNLQKRLKF